MRRLIISCAFILLYAISFSQAFSDHLFNGDMLFKAKDYEGAISDYSKALKMDPNHTMVLTRRGSCYYNLQKYESALKDLNKAIFLNNKLTDAYAFRMKTLEKLENYKEALADVEVLMKLDTVHVSYYLIGSGWYKVKLGRRDEGCEDFSKAKALGNIEGSQYKRRFCINQTKSGEYLWLFWKEIGDWKYESVEENDFLSYLEIYHEGENADHWTEQGMMYVEKNKNIPLHEQMYSIYNTLLEKNPTAKLKYIESNLTGEYPYIIYSISIPYLADTDISWSLLNYLVQGKLNQHTNVITIRKKKFSKKEEKKWVNFFKTSIITYKP